MAVLSVLACFSRCSPKQSQTENGDDEAHVSFDDSVYYGNIAYHPIPNTYWFSFFDDADLDFQAKVLIPTDVDLSELNELNQMLLFGANAADLTYCIVTDHTAEGLQYLKNIVSLAEQLKLDSVFTNRNLLDAYMDHAENRDSLRSIAAVVQADFDNYLEEKDIHYTSAVYFAGAWIEGMYLGACDYEKNPERDDVGMLLSEQVAIADNIIKGLDLKELEKFDLDWLLNDLATIVDTFDHFESVVKYYEDPELDFFVLNKEEIKEMFDLVVKLRKRTFNY